VQFRSAGYIARPLPIISTAPAEESTITQYPAAKELNMKIKNLRDLFEIELRYVYDCEQKLVKKGLPLMIESSTSGELRTALEQHLEETRNHVARLERVFSSLGYEAKTEGNDVVDELTSSVKDMVGDIDESYLRDAALIVGGNKVEHYEMAVYGSLVAFAEQLGSTDAAALLSKTLEEEKEADAKLTQIAKTAINPQAGTERRAA
jgi:ferritin-like metal-binding protein YciE